MYQAHLQSIDNETESQRGNTNSLKVTYLSLVMDLSLDFEHRRSRSRMEALNHPTVLYKLKLAAPKE